MAEYISDFTHFLKQYKETHPETEQQQRAGRALLWDRPPRSLDEQQRRQASLIQQTPYVYQSNGQ